jgi:hypothetical protein
MPKIFEKNGFVIYVYPYELNERHHLIHVHVYRGSFGGDSMVVEIPSLAILANNLKTGDKRKAMELISDNLAAILAKLEENN